MTAAVRLHLELKVQTIVDLTKSKTRAMRHIITAIREIHNARKCLKLYNLPREERISPCPWSHRNTEDIDKDHVWITATSPASLVRNTSISQYFFSTRNSSSIANVVSASSSRSVFLCGWDVCQRPSKPSRRHVCGSQPVLEDKDPTWAFPGIQGACGQRKSRRRLSFRRGADFARVTRLASLQPRPGPVTTWKYL